MAPDPTPPQDSTQDSMQHPRTLGREVRRTMSRATTRANQRRRLVHLLAFALFLVTVAAAPGYLGPVPRFGSLLTLGATAAVCVLSYLIDRIAKNVTLAAYVLVGGGALVTLAHVGVAALSGDIRATDQAALFLLPVIFAAGVLFTVEVIILLLVLSMSLTGAALLFALAQAQQAPGNEIYLMMVTTLGLQALLGLIAVLVAQFLHESSYELQRSEQVRLAQGHAATLMGQQASREQSLRAEIKVLQEAITRVLAGANVSGVPVVDGELAELMKSFNLLLDYMHTRGASPQTAASDGTTRQMLELIGQINEGGAAVAYDVDAQMSGALGTVMQALLHLQARSAHRFTRMQELISDVNGAVKTGLDGLGNTSADVVTAKQLAGKLVSAASNVLPGIKTAHALVMQARDRVGMLLPPELLQAAAADAIHRDARDLTPEEAARLLGRYDDLEGLDILDATSTIEFEALPAHETESGSASPDIPPLTMRLPAVSTHGSGPRAAGAPSDERQQEHLLELWRMLDRLVATLAYEYHMLQSLSRDLGKLSRTVRNADAGVVHGIASMEAASEALKDLHDAALPGRGPTYPGAVPSRPSQPFSAPRPQPVASRPVAAGQGATLPAAASPMSPARTTDPQLGMLSADDLFRDAGELGQLDVNQLIDPDLRDGTGH
ncbi:MAG TPA: hypothetical protein VF120_11545 [Ktedonobacterales bacterium]